MSVKSRLAAVLAVAATLIGGTATAAVVPIEQSMTLLNPASGLVFNIATDGNASASTTSYYELVVDPSWNVPTRFTTFSTEPLGTSASYALYTDTNAAVGAGNTGTPLDAWALIDVIGNNTIPFHTALLTAGQYILQINTLPGQLSISTQISAVPLPGALWMFGSALLGFLGFSKRRKV